MFVRIGSHISEMKFDLNITLMYSAVQLCFEISDLKKSIILLCQNNVTQETKSDTKSSVWPFTEIA